MLDRTRLRRKSFGTIILIKSILYFIAVSVSQLFVFLVYHVFSIFPVDVNAVQSELYPSATISMLVYFTFVILLISFLQQINKKFGNGILLSMITGKYYRPRKERRIFMFLDMKDSTGTAERLGHVQYSRLIQSCIHELSDLITRYKAQVYQYVGDEVVLTWPTTVGLKDMNCINLYFAFRQVLEDRRDYYKKNYNTLPEFKAGIAEGIITVTEVGEIKRELAYHGDVLHTAARLEKMCNKLKNNVLITEKMISLLNRKNGYDMELLGEFRLKGKEGLDKVYGVKLNV
jgi:adenylate cyclase